MKAARVNVRRAESRDLANSSDAPPSEVLPLIGAKITPVDRGYLYDWITNCISTNRKATIASHNLHSLYLWETDLEFRAFSEKAELVLVDGFPVLQLARFVAEHRLTKRNRLGSLDWVPGLLTHTPVLRLAVVGGSPVANARAVSALGWTSSTCIVNGWPGHGWGPDRASEVVSDLRDFDPNVVLVGLGMPLQEKFLLDYSNALPNCVYATVGGAIDQIARVQRPAPRWLGPLGLEWLWRLISQPRRLARRYLIEPWLLIFLVISRRVRNPAPKPNG